MRSEVKKWIKNPGLSHWEMGGLILFCSTIIALLIGLLGRGYILYGLFIFNGVLITGALAMRHPSFMVLGYLLSSIIYLNNYPGIPLPELLFFIYTVFIVLALFLPDLLRFKIHFYSGLDKIALLFIILLAYGTVLGYLNGAKPVNLFGDLTYYAGFLTYFAFLKYFHRERFRKTLLVLLIGIIVYILVRNAINYQQIIIEAYALWQIQKARAATNEVFILAGSSFFLSAFLYVKSYLHKSFYLFLLLAGIGGIVITQSRGYWIALLFSFFIMFLIAEKSQKKQILLVISVSLVAGILVISIFFSDLFHIIYDALLYRLSSIFDIFTERIGPSLRQRILETKKVMGKIIENPIAGYGFGVTYSRFLTVPHIYKEVTYIHNGYLAIWFKLGLVGFITILYYCYLIFKYCLHIYRNTSRWAKPISHSIIGILGGMLLVNVTSPQFFSFGSMFLMALMGIFASYYYNQYKYQLNKHTGISE